MAEMGNCAMDIVCDTLRGLKNSGAVYHMDDAQQADLRRVKWACRRGMLELDLIFERYVNERYLSADEAEQNTFKHLLGCEDQQLFDWLIKRQPCEEPQFTNFVEKLITP